MNALNSSKTICVVTATRAEYGLLSPLIREVEKSDKFNMRLVVTGTHLSHEFGYTKNNIIDDGFEISEEIDCVISNDSPSSIGKTAALALTGLTDAFSRLKPDLIILLGDRYEILSAAIAASFCHIPVAHLHGGEITEGAYDEGFRHAITKLSHLHFTSSEEHRNRVIQMGEDPDYVFNVGAIGLDNIKNISPLSREDLQDQLGIKFKKKNILVTLHPETMNPGSSEKNVGILLECLSELEDTFIVFTGTNADSEGRIINKKLKEYASNSDNSIFIDSLGQLKYISMLHIVDAVVGNSSSGIIEAPSFGIPTINIGDRQKGRLRADSVIDVAWNIDSIHYAIKVQSSGVFLGENPYGNGNTSELIMKYLTGLSWNQIYFHKKFYDINQVV